MMLFWILAITDLIMVGITWAVYGSSATYRDGMLLAFICRSLLHPSLL